MTLIEYIASVAHVCERRIGEEMEMNGIKVDSILNRAYRSFVHYVRVQLDRGGGDELVTYVERGIAGRYTLFVFLVFFPFLPRGRTIDARSSIIRRKGSKETSTIMAD